jgi:hypothetical protein
MSRGLNNIRELAARLFDVQEQARSLGLFAGDRDLLECRKCGLLEDVTATGQLITCRLQALGRDTGFRFKELPQNRFRCPACDSIIRQG